MASVGMSMNILNRCFLRNFSNTRPLLRFSSSFQKYDTMNSRRSSMGIVAIGITAGVMVAATYSGKAILSDPAIKNRITGEEQETIPEFPDVRIARKVVSSNDDSNLQLVLFQYPTCPFCCKVRAFLDYNGISYEVVEVNPVLRKEMSWSQYKKVPVLLAKIDGGYQQLNDSTMIISALKSYLMDKNVTLTDIVKFYPNVPVFQEDRKVVNEIVNRYFLMFQSNVDKLLTNEQIVEERKWRKWADDKLVHTLSPNVYRSKDEALQAFTWFSEVGEWERLFPKWERNLIVYGGATAMYALSYRLKKRYNLKDDVRQSLYDECNTWMTAIKKKGTPFMGGSEPNLADLAVYGVLSSIEGCTAFEDLKSNTKIGGWYYSVKDIVNSRKGRTEIV